MTTLLLNSLAAALYLLAGAYLAWTVRVGQEPRRQYLFAAVAVALLVHGLGVFSQVMVDNTVELGFFRVSSLLFWVINLIVLASSLRKPLHNLFIPLLPLSAVGVLASLLGQGAGHPIVLDYALASHVLLSILAYSLLTIATLQALLLAWQNHQLKHRHPTGRVRLLPPLQTMEALLFELLWAGHIALTLSILSGFVFLDDLFAQHLVHKTVFSLAAWVIYSVLLWGRHQLGWRGYTAIRWTLGGFVLLMLAYFGSKLVLELILDRY
ncbi:cytochrome C assembly family protein [Marinimicrobium sp. ARAG 43.8]|uniref:cytochrome C assembly family protein n=1 Tax=Marinimicrobium sp. ARAG 43.8 TaxID=3418719 RepID=UPI003CF73543